jgi:hypothetical protein
MANNSEKTKEFLEKYIKYVNSYKNYKILKDKNIDNLIQVFKSIHEYEHNKNVHSIDDTSESDSNNKTYIKKNIRGTIKKISIIDSITYNKRWLKIKHCLEFLKCAGFNSLEYVGKEKQKLKINWDEMLRYCRENEKEIRSVFECKENVFGSDVTVDEKKSIIHYINSKLLNVIGFSITSRTNKRVDYYLEDVFKHLVQDRKNLRIN